MATTVNLIERIGDGRESVSDHLHVLDRDVFSGGPTDFAKHAIRGDVAGSPTYSMERWFRWRFEQPFMQVWDFYFWVPGLVIPAGWTLRYGTAQEFATPVNAVSSIAVLELPTSKPVTPNVGGIVPLEGTETRYSDWIVLQASVNADADIGPMLGFHGTEPVGIEYRLDWTES